MRQLHISICSKFADDTKCGQVIRSPGDVATLQECLDNLVDWSNRWGMQFNVNKCKVMHVGRNNNHDIPVETPGSILGSQLPKF